MNRFLSSCILAASFVSMLGTAQLCFLRPVLAEKLLVSGVKLISLQGSSVTGDGSYIPAVVPPDPGDIVQVLDNWIGMTAFRNLKPITVFWEDRGPKADFDCTENVCYLNGRPFALALCSQSSWDWLAAVVPEDVAGVRYIGIGGIVPEGFERALANLPKGKVIVGFNEECFENPVEALAPIEPVGLVYSSEWNRLLSDFSSLESCVYIGATYTGDATLRLPPSVKTLHCSMPGGGILKLSGAEGTLENISMNSVQRIWEWIHNYQAIRNISLSGSGRVSAEAKKLVDALAALPVLVGLRIDLFGAKTSLLRGMKGLRRLMLWSDLDDIQILAELPEIEYLDIRVTSNFDVAVLSSLPNLKTLRLSIVHKWTRPGQEKEVFDFAMLAPIADKITFLSVDSNIKLVNQAKIAALENLESLNIFGIGTDTMPLEHIVRLSKLSCIPNVFVNSGDLSPLTKLPLLETLHLNITCKTDISVLKACASLRELDISTGRDVDLSGIGEILQLLRLQVNVGYGTREGASQDRGLPALSKLKWLRRLDLNALGLTSLDFLEAMSSVTCLSVSGFSGDDFTVFRKMGNLRILSISATAPAPRIDIHPNLRCFSMSCCPGLESLAFLEGAEGLESLWITACPSLKTLPKLKTPLRRLRWLGITQCTTLTDTSGVASFPNLEYLSMSGYSGSKIAGLDSLKSLSSLFVSHVKLEAIPEISPDAPLVAASFGGARSINSIGALSKWKNLRSLDIELGNTVSDLSPFASLSSLVRLAMKGGVAIEDVTPLGSLTALRMLDIRDCAFSYGANNEWLKKALPQCSIRCREEFKGRRGNR